MPDVRRRSREAALAYGGLGVLVIVITFAAGLVPRSRTAQLAELGIGVIFVVIFAALVWRGWWPLSLLLVFTNLWRALTYFDDGLGWRLELMPFSLTRIEPKPIAFVNAALMAAIVAMLARAGVAGFATWRSRRTSAKAPGA